jgi:hypothetical protein
MQSNILGILVMADKLCLQVDLKEYLKHQKQHREYKTATAIEEFRNLRDMVRLYSLRDIFIFW